jgi:hypothetical protein
VLLRDSLEHATYADLSNPRTRFARHPLAPFLTVPQPPPDKQNLGTALDPFPGRGLQTPLVLAPPRSTTVLGPADDLPSRMIDSYLLGARRRRSGGGPGGGWRSRARRHPLTSPWWALETP